MFFFRGRLTQKERLELEQEYIERMRSLKRKRETVPHRETHEMMMGGSKVLMFERYKFFYLTCCSKQVCTMDSLVYIYHTHRLLLVHIYYYILRWGTLLLWTQVATVVFFYSLNQCNQCTWGQIIESCYYIDATDNIEPFFKDDLFIKIF